MSPPVAFIVYNRPYHTEQTFSAIRSQRPEKLFVIADGPSAENPTDIERCRKVRAIVDEVDWPCEVYRDYAESNLGLKRRVSSGLDWVFRNVDTAIVLEDDCLPHADFFIFCEELLRRYLEDDRIWAITGNNFQDGRDRGEAAYYFSKYSHCWGWATWRRAWQHYRAHLPFWPEWKVSKDWKRKHPNRLEQKHWERAFDQVYEGRIDSWAYPWNATVWFHGGLTATPNVNLVSNIGFGPEATHTRRSYDEPGLEVHSLPVITHPDNIYQDVDADLYVFMNSLGGKYLGYRGFLRRAISRMLRKSSGN